VPNDTTNRNIYKHALLLAGLSSLFFVSIAEAATGRSFIGPHEYALPTDVPDGFKVFVGYAYYETSDEFYNDDGDKLSSDRNESLVTLAKFSQGWTLKEHPSFGYAYEVILPVIGSRNRTANTSASGVGDPIVAPYIWYEIAEGVKVGTDLLITLPIGQKDVGGGDSWKVMNSVFIDVQMNKFNYTGDVIWNYPGESNRFDDTVGKSWSTEHVFGYRTTELIEPYVGAAYEYQRGSSINVANSETDILVGLMFHLKNGRSTAIHLAHAVDGKNRPASSSLNFRFVRPF
jgi:hypothetical protein